MESKILQGLNRAQYDAVVNYESPSLIIAGAGSGKTRVLTSRIAYMLEQGVKPWNILALTFTNKAASQMRERIEQMVEGSASRYIRMGTFHSVFSRILRENAERIGYTQSFTIYEPNDCKNLLKTICKELGLADDKYKPQRILSRISYAKNALITPGAYIANASFVAEDRQAQIPRFGEVYEAYCRRCKHNGAMDFDDLLLQTNILLRDCPDVLEKYQEQFLADLRKSNREFVRLRNGVTYKIVKLGDQNNQSLVSRDTLSLALSIYDQSGNVIREQDTLVTAYRDLMEGLREVIRITGKGGNVDIWVPSKYAYGSEGNAEQGIKPNQLLNYKVDIFDINFYNKK